MRAGVAVRRFLLPRSFVTLYYMAKCRAFVSPHAEVEMSPLLTLGRGSSISSFAKVKVSEGPVRIGARTDIGSGCFIGGHAAGIEIGDDCLISPNASVIGVNYRYDRLDLTFREQGVVSQPTRLGNNVWVGAGAVVLSGAQIGDGVIINANAVVSGKIPDNAIVQGNPGKVVFTRR